MPIRIYALAKDLKIDSKELVEICTKAGITGKGSALASLTDDEAEKVKGYVSGNKKPEHAAPIRPIRPSSTKASSFTRDDYISPGGARKSEEKATPRAAPPAAPPTAPPAAPPTAPPAAPPTAAPVAPPAAEKFEAPIRPPQPEPPPQETAAPGPIKPPLKTGSKPAAKKEPKGPIVRVAAIPQRRRPLPLPNRTSRRHRNRS